MSTQGSTLRRRSLAGRAVVAAFAATLLLAGCAAPAGSDTAADAPSTSSPQPTTEKTTQANGAAKTAPLLAPEAPSLAAGEHITPIPAGDAEAAGTAPRCVDEQLSLSYSPNPERSGMSKTGMTLTFANISDSTCRVWGSPGLIAIDAAGNAIGAPGNGGPWDAEVVVLDPGESTALGGTITQAGVYTCDVVTAWGLSAAVTSDGAGPRITVEHPFEACADPSITMLYIDAFGVQY